MSGIQLSTEEIRRQVAKAIDLIVHIELFQDGMRRITFINDSYYDDKTGKVVLPEIFKFEVEKIDENGKTHGHWDFNRKKPSFYEDFAKRYVTLPQGFFE
jgi:pilus assembly protein CpaF